MEKPFTCEPLNNASIEITESGVKIVQAVRVMSAGHEVGTDSIELTLPSSSADLANQTQTVGTVKTLLGGKYVDIARAWEKKDDLRATVQQALEEMAATEAKA